MRRPKPHFSDNQRLRSGVFFLLLLLVCFQLLIYVVGGDLHSNPVMEIRVDRAEQAWIDSVKATRENHRDSFPVRPFNPNYINDYRGYRLGVSPYSLDRIYAFRKAGGWFTDREVFQKVGGIPDSVFDAYQHILQFPETRAFVPRKAKAVKAGTGNLNTATEEDLIGIYGVGPVLSRRILKFRKALGGFRDSIQLYDVYGLEKEVAQRISARFKVAGGLDHKKLSLNKATAEELNQILYLRGELAGKIAAYRDRNGPYRSLEELQRFEGISAEKIKRIALYLTL